MASDGEYASARLQVEALARQRRCGAGPGHPPEPVADAGSKHRRERQQADHVGDRQVAAAERHKDLKGEDEGEGT
jgi:hypothetical protein